jgi:uncharacterized protein YndB with AHSA1/START domain
MKQKFEVVIDASKEKIWAAMDNPENMGRWQSNFHSYTHTSGEPGQVGSTGELVFNENGKHVVLKETVTERREPDFFAGTYEADHGTTMIVNHFDSIDEKTTRWTSWCNFQFTGMMKYLAIFIAGAIRKRTQGDMERFKLMVETDEAAE